MEEFEIALAELVELAEREKLEELAMSPYDYFEELEEEEKTHLYRCYDNQNQLLYAGVSLSAFNRFIQHKSSSKWAKKMVININIEHFDSRELALAAEKAAIKTEYPKFNIQHNHGKRPSGLGSATICSFKYHCNNGKVVTGLRIASSLYPDAPDVVMGKMDEKIFDIAGNAQRLYRIICFEEWSGKSLEIEIKALMSILGFEYMFEYFEDLRRMVIDPALEMITNYSEKHLTYTTKKTEECITHIVFESNKEPIPQPTYLEVLADRLGIDREDLKIYEKVRQKLYPDD